MDIKNYEIKDQADVFSFFLYLMKDLNLNFHPDTPFSDYDDKDGNKLFSQLQVNILTTNLYTCNHRIDGSGCDVYFIANLANHFLQLYEWVEQANQSLTHDTMPSSHPDALLEQIKNTYFEGALKRDPYIVNWSLKAAFKNKKLDTATHYRITPSIPNEVKLTFFANGTLLGDSGGHSYIYTSIAKAYQDLDEILKFGLKIEPLPIGE